MDDGDLIAQRGVDGPVSLEAVLAGEKRGDDEGGEGLAAAACLDLEKGEMLVKFAFMVLWCFFFSRVASFELQYVRKRNGGVRNRRLL
jgi:hypothetical protein